MYVFITILILVAALLMVLVVLVQNSKGGGLASGFSSTNQMMGVRKTTDFVEKATWSLAGIIIVLSVVAAAFLPKASENTSEIQNIVNTQVPVTNQGFEKQVPAATTAPAIETAPATEAPAPAKAPAN